MSTHVENGVEYSLGCMPAKQWKSGVLQAAPDVMPIYTRQEIIAELEKLGGKKVLPFPWECNHQGGDPYCWAYSAVQMAQATLHLINGSMDILDPSLGPIITDSIGQGNGIEEMWVRVALKFGIPSAADMGTDPLHSKIIRNERGLPDKWKEFAAKHVGVTSVEAHDVLQLASGILNDHYGNFGVTWGGSGGHAIGAAEIGLLDDVRSTIYVATPGTWGPNYQSGWGAYGAEKPGWYKLSERQCATAWSGPTFGAYLLVGIKDES